MPKDVSMDIRQPQFIIDKYITSEQCKKTIGLKSITFFKHSRTYGNGKIETSRKWTGDIRGEYVNECERYERITRGIFASHKQDIIRKTQIEVGKTFNRNKQLLPCSLDDFGVKRTSLDHYAYSWEAFKKFIMSALKEQDALMLKNVLQFYVGRVNHSSIKYLFEVTNYLHQLCNKPKDVYPTI